MAMGRFGALFFVILASLPMGSPAQVLLASPQAVSVDLGLLGRLSKSPGKSLFQGFRDLGFDPSKIRIHWEKIEASGDAHMFSLFYNEQSIGYARTEAALFDARKIVIIEDKIEVSEEYRYRGFGLLLYLAMAKTLYEKSGHVLHRSGVVSADATSLWKKLLKNGWAEVDSSTGSEIHRMKESFLKALLSAETLCQAPVASVIQL